MLPERKECRCDVSAQELNPAMAPPATTEQGVTAYKDGSLTSSVTNTVLLHSPLGSPSCNCVPVCKCHRVAD